jgi:hypothetical protein
MKLSKLDLGLLSMNLIAVGGLLVLMALRGPSIPAALLAFGAGLSAIAKLGKAFLSTAA